MLLSLALNGYLWSDRCPKTRKSYALAKVVFYEVNLLSFQNICNLCRHFPRICTTKTFYDICFKFPKRSSFPNSSAFIAFKKQICVFTIIFVFFIIKTKKCKLSFLKYKKNHITSKSQKFGCYGYMILYNSKK